MSNEALFDQCRVEDAELIPRCLSTLLQEAIGEPGISRHAQGPIREMIGALDVRHWFAAFAQEERLDTVDGAIEARRDRPLHRRWVIGALG